MLSGEGNENGEKTTIGLISKKATLHVQHTFFVHFFAVVLHDYDVKLPETSQLHNFWRKTSYVFSFTFSMPLILNLALVAASICHHRYKIFMLFFQQKEMFLLFFFYLLLQISVFLSLVELRWPATYFLSFSVFLLLYIPNLWA